ncbi:MAG: hypothetical protein FWC60_10800, partial [Firmicutes bacterium]|nr:hypothetical protein [Bacillota bacterium]
QIEQAMPLLEYRLKQALAKHGDSPFQKEAVLAEMLPVLAAMHSELERTEGIKLVAASLLTGYHVIAEEFTRFFTQQRKKWTKSDNITNNKHNITNREATDFGVRAELGLLKLMLEDTGRLSQVAGLLPGNFFVNQFCHGIYNKVLELMGHAHFSLSILLDYLEEDEQQRLGALLMEPFPGDDIDAILADYIGAIKKRALMQSRSSLQAVLADTEKSGDREETTRILRQISSIDRTLKGGEMCHAGRPE